MIAYVTIGTNDTARAHRFYTALLQDLGYVPELRADGISCALPVPPGQTPIHPELYIKTPYDGQTASAGNGAMIAFEARTQQQVRDLHADALAAGGSDDGAPGFRAAYGPNFYVGYLRDPDGNKIALFSSNPDEPGRDD